MRLPLKERTIPTMVVIPSAIIVLALAVLQYRWSATISETTAVRLADSLQMSMTNWQKDFFRYFSEITLALRIDPSEDAPGDVEQYVRRFAEWQSLTRYPKLVSNVYFLKSESSDRPRALKLNPSTRHFEPGDWPGRFEPIRSDLEKLGSRLRNTSAGSSGQLDQIRSEQRERRVAYGILDLGDPATSWRFEPGIPALVHPVLRRVAPSPGQSIDWLAIELNPEEIRTKILNDLAETYFQGTDGLDYQVAVVSAGKPGGILYTSDPGFGVPQPADADGTIDLFGPSGGSRRSPIHVFHTPSESRGPAPSSQIFWFPLLRPRAESADWRLVVRHRRGGALGAFVMETRRRDLGIGFGVLLVLVVNMAMLIATSHRAQRLAQLQMNFVTAVSHELRTPLTVIISGADNLCNGVVETKQQILQYGSVIGNQARELFGLVEQILLFAVSRQGGLHYHLRPLEVRAVVEAALRNTAGFIEAGHFTVECDIAPELPRVAGDSSALAQCLQNLIINALKYAAEQRWLRIRASVGKRDSGGEEVQIAVSDRGIGISPDDLPHIFEPFYRSPAARAAQIHGTGLGLPLSQSIVEAMNGRLTVTSVPAHGSTFTLHLPL